MIPFYSPGKHHKTKDFLVFSGVWNGNIGQKLFRPFLFYKQSIFDSRPKNFLSFSKKLPKKLLSNFLVDSLLTSIV